MKLALAILLAVLAVAGAQAQSVTNPAPVAGAGAYNAVAPTCTASQFCYVQVDSQGRLLVSTGSPSGGGGAPLVPSTAAASSLVLKATPGNLYSLAITVGAVSGYLLLFDATSAPVDGAVTPAYCYPVLSNGSIGGTTFNWPTPISFLTGITAVFSTTGCFTKTASATAAFFGQVN